MVRCVWITPKDWNAKREYNLCIWCKWPIAATAYTVFCFKFCCCFFILVFFHTHFSFVFVHTSARPSYTRAPTSQCICVIYVCFLLLSRRSFGVHKTQHKQTHFFLFSDLDVQFEHNEFVFARMSVAFIPCAYTLQLLSAKAILFRVLPFITLFICIIHFWFFSLSLHFLLLLRFRYTYISIITFRVYRNTV